MKSLNAVSLRKRSNQNLKKKKKKASDSVRERESELGDELSEVVGPSERNNEVKETSERKIGSDPNPSKRDSNTPPSDDCCPICFDTFVVPSRAQCGHWYCAGCILQYWNHGAVLKPCKCPKCSQPICKLTPVTSTHHRQEEGVTEVLENIWKYNHLFVGGTYGFIHNVAVLLLIIKSIFRDMVDPHRARSSSHSQNTHCCNNAGCPVQFLLWLPSNSFNFRSLGHLNCIDLFDYYAIVLVFILYVFGWPLS